MIREVLAFLSVVCYVQANFNGFDNGFGNGGFQSFPMSSQSSQFGNKAFQQFGNSGGNSAAAGNAGADGFGGASSINQANHFANQFGTSSSGLSANTAQGSRGSQASGAAQAGGQTEGGRQSQSNFGRQQSSQFGGFRRKRQISTNFGGSTFGDDEDTQTGTNFGGISTFPVQSQMNGGFGGFSGFGGQGQANANAIGGGNVMFGDISTSNNAMSQSDPNNAMGFANGNSLGQGQGVNVFQSANSNAASGMFGKRR